MFFFFSSRRRHTRLQGDWSSDVCSSDLCGREDDPGIRDVVFSKFGHRVPDGSSNTRGFYFRVAQSASSTILTGVARVGRDLQTASNALASAAASVYAWFVYRDG